MNKIDIEKVKYLIVHHSGMDHGEDPVAEIRKLHVETNGWDDIGYHFIILEDGTTVDGRPTDSVGAHCLGYNAVSFGVCIAGFGDKATPAQMFSLGRLYTRLRMVMPNGLGIKPHNEFKNTICPGFSLPWEDFIAREQISGLDFDPRAEEA